MDVEAAEVDPEAVVGGERPGVENGYTPNMEPTEVRMGTRVADSERERSWGVEVEDEGMVEAEVDDESGFTTCVEEEPAEGGTVSEGSTDEEAGVLDGGLYAGWSEKAGGGDPGLSSRGISASSSSRATRATCSAARRELRRLKSADTDTSPSRT